MLYHHDSRDYETAASDAARRAREKLEALIEKGRSRALAVLEQVETQVPQDKIAPARGLDVQVDRHRDVVVAAGPQFAERGVYERLHRNAAHQLAERAGIPRAFVEELGAEDKRAWGPDLLAHNFREILRHDPSKLLLRSVGGELRGVLSDRYRRLDSRPIVEAFAGAAADMGAVPVEGYALDTKVALKALVARVYEPVRNEVMAFGVMLENSDFGNGALQVSAFILRLFCTNYAIAEVPMRQVHLGKRLSDNISYSQRTYELDTATTVSAVNDIVRAQLEPARIDALCAAVKAADEQKVSADQINAFLAKTTTKAEAKEIKDAFASADVEMLPPGQSRWRFSNAISWIAGKTENEERRIEMMKLAGNAAKVSVAA